MKRIICFFLALCLCLCGCTQQKENRDSVSLWYVEGQQPEGLEELISEYNKALPEGILPVTLRSFPHEQSLAAAFDTRSPDLLLCYHTKAEQLFDQGRLRSCGAQLPEYGGALEQNFGFLGKSYFPIGTQVQLLAEQSELFEKEKLSNLESFCRAAMAYSQENSEPVFTADEFSALFCHALLSLDTEFHAEPALDKNEDLFKYVYNLLVESVLEGALLSTEYASLDVLLSAELPYAFVMSTTLTEIKNDLNIYPAPVFKDSLKYPGLCAGLAVTAGESRELKSLENFLNYVNQNGVNSKLALSSGLVPALPDMSQGSDSLRSCLLDIGAYYEIYLPSAESDYMKNRLRFEAVFRNTINRLY